MTAARKRRPPCEVRCVMRRERWGETLSDPPHPVYVARWFAVCDSCTWTSAPYDSFGGATEDGRRHILGRSRPGRPKKGE